MRDARPSRNDACSSVFDICHGDNRYGFEREVFLMMPPNERTTKKDLAEWAKALESGNWKQCRGRLDGRGILRCCLGVASEVWGMRTHAALQYPHPKLSSHEQGFFTTLNDHFEYDFHQIARIARQRYQVAAE